MRFSSGVLVTALLAGTALAKSCLNLTIPVTVTAKTLVINVPPPKTEFDVIAFTVNFTARIPIQSYYITGRVNTTGTFDIAATYCKPDSSYVDGKDRSGVLQFLTHGLGFNKAYWDLSYHDYKYSYVNTALSYGYSTFAIDRLSVGGSTKPAAEIAQLSLESEIVIALTKMLKAGYCSDIPAPKKVVHVGHSYGSAITNQIVKLDPTISDAIVLTGFSHVNTYMPTAIASWLQQPARWQNPARFGTEGENLPFGYNTWTNIYSNQYSFFAVNNYERNVLYLAEATKTAYTVGEAFTLTGFDTTDFVTKFTKPVLLITGHKDKIYCGSDCDGILEQSAPKFKLAQPFITYQQPATGHAMNLHINATGTYFIIQSFLTDQGF